MKSGWTRATLGQLGRYLNGRGFKKSEWGETGRPIIRIQNLTGTSGDFNYFQGEALDQHIARRGDLLVSWAATLGAYFWDGPEAVINQHIFKVESFIDKRFHKYLLDSKLAELMSHAHGSGMVHITRGKFDAVEVLLPPLEEQRRIVAILEEHLTSLDAADRSLADVARRGLLIRSVGLASLLRRAMNDEHSIRATIGELAKVGTGTTPSRSISDYYEGGTVPWVTSGDLAQRVVRSPSHFVTRDALERTSLRIYPAGTLLLAMYGEGKTRGTVAELAIPATINQACAAIQLLSDELRPWVRAALESNYWSMRQLASGGVQPNLNLRLVRSITIPIPTRGLREQLLDQQNLIEEAQDRLQPVIHNASLRSAQLRRGVLAAAFAGMLTGRSSDTDVIEELAHQEEAS